MDELICYRKVIKGILYYFILIYCLFNEVLYYSLYLYDLLYKSYYNFQMIEIRVIKMFILFFLEDWKLNFLGSMKVEL